MSEELPVNNKKSAQFSAKILLAEDSPINQLLMTRLLQKCGVTVTTVTDGQSAVEKVSNGQYDLILMDIHMPVLDGINTTQKLRAAGVTIPIIAWTTISNDNLVKNLKESGCSDVLPKPFKPEELVAILEKYLSAPPSEESIDLDKAELDKFSRKYAHDLPLLITELHAAQKSGNREATENLAHKLSGSVMFGFKELSNKAIQIEKNSAAELMDQNAKLFEELDQICQAIYAQYK